MIIHNVEQRSGEWFRLRLGKVTASNAHRLLTPVKFKTFYLELLAETITRHITEHGMSDAMEWGIEQEPFAMEWYANKTQYDVSTCGFVELEDSIAGCSPDLVIGDEGMCQIKCPTPKVHLEYMHTGPSSEIITQMQFEMMVYGAKWNDFLSFDPRYPEQMKGHIVRIGRDEAMIKKLADKTKEMQSMIEEFCFDRNIKIHKYVPVLSLEPEPEDLSKYLMV